MDVETDADLDGSAVADRLVVSYRAADADPAGLDADPDGPDADSDGLDADPAEGDGFDERHLVHERIHERPFRAYLVRVHGGPVTEGDEWSEFVNCGCGTTTDVTLRVEAVEGGTRLGEATVVELVSVEEA